MEQTEIRKPDLEEMARAIELGALNGTIKKSAVAGVCNVIFSGGYPGDPDEVFINFLANVRENKVSPVLINLLLEGSEAEIFDDPLMPKEFKGLKIKDRVVALFSEDPEVYDVYIGLHSDNSPDGEAFFIEEIKLENGKVFLISKSSNGEAINYHMSSALRDKHIAPGYLIFKRDPDEWEALARSVDKSHLLLADVIKEHLDPDEDQKVVNLGAGTGLTEEHFVDSRLRFACIDAEPAMAEVLRAKNLRNVESGEEFILGFGKRLSFQDESLDAVVSNGALYYLPSLKWTIMEAARTIKAGGKLIFSFEEPVEGVHVDFDDSRNPLGNEREDAHSSNPKLKNFADGRTNRIKAKYGCFVYGHRLEDVRGIVESQGFKVVSVRKEFVHIEPNYQLPVYFTYLSAEKVA